MSKGDRDPYEWYGEARKEIRYTKDCVREISETNETFCYFFYDNFRIYYYIFMSIN